jgi:ParB family transcriptional regulator, chromosome partitioning protein
VAERTRGMGRGLAAILTTSPADAAAELRELPVELISPNPQQPRRIFEEASLVALAESLKDRGVLQPVLVRPVPGGTYELIAGERRWRAAQLAGLVEELGLTREDVGRRVGRSRVAVSNLLRLLELPDEALSLIADGVLSEGHGRALLMAPDHDSRRRLARDAGAHGWSVRQTEARARAAAGREEGAIAAGRIERAPHPDQVEAAERLVEAFGRALGADVRVTPNAKGYRVQFAFDTLDEALEAAERLGVTAAA